MAVLDVFEEEGLVENALAVGNYLMEGLNELRTNDTAEHIKDIRGRGLMIGIDLDVPHKDVRVPLIHEEHCHQHSAPAAPSLPIQTGSGRIHTKTKQHTEEIMKISIIGVGAMGGALAEGLIKGDYIQNEDICVADPSRLSRERFADMGITATPSNQLAAQGADIVCVVVKPWLVEQVLKSIKDVLDYQQQTLVVVAAGVKSSDITSWLDKGGNMLPTFLVIPNIAIAQLQSMTFIVPGASATQQQTDQVRALFDSMGQSIITDEQHLAAGTTLASCGIAYAMRYIRAASEGGVELGFKADEAKQIVMQTVKGAVDLLQATGLHPEAAIDLVTTPGGVTIKGLNEMEHAGFTSAVIRGLKAGAK